jgi:TRAP-type C4-dicarboxylate transport system substrate-binding protein
MAAPRRSAYGSARSGVVEASTNYIMAVGPIRHNEVTDYFIKMGLGQALQAEIINVDFWNSLPEDIQETIGHLAVAFMMECFSVYVIAGLSPFILDMI